MGDTSVVVVSVLVRACMTCGRCAVSAAPTHLLTARSCLPLRNSAVHATPCTHHAHRTLARRFPDAHRLDGATRTLDDVVVVAVVASFTHVLLELNLQRFVS